MDCWARHALSGFDALVRFTTHAPSSSSPDCSSHSLPSAVSRLRTGGLCACSSKSGEICLATRSA